VTWRPQADRASNATYRLYDGPTLVRTATVNQRSAPVGPEMGGVAYQSLGVVTLTGGSLRVVLDNWADGFVVADAVRIAPATAAQSAVGAGLLSRATLGAEAVSLDPITSSRALSGSAPRVEGPALEEAGGVVLGSPVAASLVLRSDAVPAGPLAAIVKPRPHAAAVGKGLSRQSPTPSTFPVLGRTLPTQEAPAGMAAGSLGEPGSEP
ncbi:MAG TPA: hypothetical protein VF590_27585, partial [Isosphaeraceae bacterium]